MLLPGFRSDSGTFPLSMLPVKNLQKASVIWLVCNLYGWIWQCDDSFGWFLAMKWITAVLLTERTVCKLRFIQEDPTHCNELLEKITRCSLKFMFHTYINFKLLALIWFGIPPTNLLKLKSLSKKIQERKKTTVKDKGRGKEKKVKGRIIVMNIKYV